MIIVHRDSFTDILKALAILMVVYGHMARGVMDAGLGDATVTAWLKLIDFAIYTTHIPLFFLIAGYHTERTLKAYPLRVYFSKKIWGVLYPYLLWSVLLISMNVGLANYVNTPFKLTDILGLPYQPLGVYWFLYVLFAMGLAVLLFKRKPTLFALVGLALMGLEFSGVAYPLSVMGSFSRNVVFFALGYLLASHKIPLQYKTLIHPLTGLAAALMFILGVLALWQTGIKPVSLLTLPLTLAGLLVVLQCAHHITQTPLKPWFAWVGVCSMAIFVMHVFLTAGLRIILVKLDITAVPLLLIIGTSLGVVLPMVTYALAKHLKLAAWLGLTGTPPLTLRLS